MKSRIGFGAIIASLAVAGVAHAQNVVTDFIESNSFGLGLSPAAGGPYDLVAARIVSAGDVFEAFSVSQGTPFMSNEPGWSLGFFSSTMVVASGPGLNPLVWGNATFAGDFDTEDVVWEIAFWEVGAFGAPTLAVNSVWDWDVQDFQEITASSWDITRDGAQSLIPLPTPLGMGLAGLGLIGVARRRR